MRCLLPTLFCLLLAGCAGGDGAADPSSAPTGIQTGRHAARPVASLDRDALVSLLSDERDDVDVQKRYAATLLGILADRSAVTVLSRVATGGRDEQVRLAALRSLGQIGDRSVVPDLVRFAGQDRPGESPATLRLAAIAALGRIGGREALAFLESRATGRADPEALAALAALGDARTPARDAWFRGWEGAPSDHFDDRDRLPPLLEAQQIYVDATLGDDRGEGTVAAPFRTLAKAISVLRREAGDRIHASAGRDDLPFREEVTLGPEQGGHPQRPTVLGAWEGRPPPHMDGAAEEATPAAPLRRLLDSGIVINGSWIRVEDFTVRNYITHGIAILHGEQDVVARCHAINSKFHGLFAYHATGATFVEPHAEGCEAQGISIRSSPGTAILGGWSHDNGIDGLLLLHDSDDVVVHGFEASGNKRGLALIYGSERARLVGVTLTGNSSADLDVCPNCSAEPVASVIGRVLEPYE